MIARDGHSHTTVLVNSSTALSCPLRRLYNISAITKQQVANNHIKPIETSWNFQNPSTLRDYDDSQCRFHHLPSPFLLAIIFQGMEHLQGIEILDHLGNRRLDGNTVHVLLHDSYGHPQPADTVYVPTIPESAERFAYTLEVMFAAMTVSRAQLTDKHIRLGFSGFGNGGSFITLSQLASIMDRHEALYGGPLRAWKFLESCSLLEMAFFNENRTFPSLEAQAAFGRFITPLASNLTELESGGFKNRHDEAMLPIVHQLAQEVHFPKLQMLYFSRASIHSADLEAFSHRYASTLEWIHLHSVRLDSGGWRRFLSNLSVHAMPKLTVFGIHAPYESAISRQEDGSYEIGEPWPMYWPSTRAEKADDWELCYQFTNMKACSEKNHERLLWLGTKIQDFFPEH